MNKHIKLFEQFKGIESSLLESFLDKLETEAPGVLKTAEIIDPEEPPQENEAFVIWRKWVELQIKFGAILSKVSDARGSKEEMIKIESEMKSIVSESTNWLNQEIKTGTINGEEYKSLKNSNVVWLLYALKEELGDMTEFGVASMYGLIKKPLSQYE
jgi:hypothetical protein